MIRGHERFSWSNAFLPASSLSVWKNLLRRYCLQTKGISSLLLWSNAGGCRQGLWCRHVRQWQSHTTDYVRYWLWRRLCVLFLAENNTNRHYLWCVEDYIRVVEDNPRWIAVWCCVGSYHFSLEVKPFGQSDVFYRHAFRPTILYLSLVSWSGIYRACDWPTKLLGLIVKIGLKTILPSPSFDNHSFVEQETEEFFEFGLTISSFTNGLIGCTQTSEQCSVA